MKLNKPIFVTSFALAFILAYFEYGFWEAFATVFVLTMVIGTCIAVVQYIGEQLRKPNDNDFDI